MDLTALTQVLNAVIRAWVDAEQLTQADFALAAPAGV